MGPHIGLAIVDEMHGGKETRQLRTIGAQVLVALAARLAATATLTRWEDTALTPGNPA